MCTETEEGSQQTTVPITYLDKTVWKGLHEKWLGVGRTTPQITPMSPRDKCPASEHLKREGTKI